jgi:hypothetical protein
LPLPAGHLDFDDLLALESDLLDAVGGLDVFEEKLRGFFRAAIDEVIDTARTGRFFFNQLEKTEKTYLGTKFEIILRDWLQVPRGVTLDLLIGGREVDVKSTTGGAFGWMIPPEAIGQLCILLMINEEEATCSFGLVRARASYLRQGGNRDSKTSFTAAARSNIWWMARDFPYTSNFWHRVQEKDRTEIMSLKGGSRRVACLFERYQGVAISRVQILAVARQDDAMRRLRRGSGARGLLARKGIAILYSGYDRELMLSLGLTFGWREFMSFSPETPVQADLLRSAGHID